MGAVPSSADGSVVTFADAGRADPALVFIHGLMGNRSDFDYQAREFSATHRTVAVDLPGLATSAPHRNEWTMATFGEDVATVVDHLGLKSTILIGHSLGGDVTVEAASHLDGRVRGLVWISSYRELGTPASDASMAAWLEPFTSDFGSAMDDLARRNFGPDAEPALVEEVVARGADMDPGAVLGVLSAKSANEPAVLNGIEKLDLPVVAINPDFKSSDRASLAAHGVDLVVMPGVGHFAMMEDPDAFNLHLQDAIDRITERNP